MSALANDIGDDPVDSDACENHRKHSERTEQSHRETL